MGWISMRRVLIYMLTGLCLLLLNSCAGLGIGLAVSAFSIEAYEEARVHRPDLKLKPINSHIESIQTHIMLPKLPSLKFFSNQPTEKTNAAVSPTFGFDCSRLESEGKQSECFNDFSRTLAQQKDNDLNTQKNKLSAKKKERLVKTLKVAKASKTPPSKPAASESLPSSYIENWANAWEKQDIASYLSFYSKEFKGFKNHRGAWEASRQKAFKKNKNITIKLSNIQIHQKGKEKIEVNFIQKYKSDAYADTGIKELLLEKRKAGWKIIKETWMPTGASTKNKHSASRTEQINKKLASWLKAWENQDVKTYLSFYSDKFKTPKASRAKWSNSRYRALKANKNISIQLSSLQISSSKKTIELNFIQEFNSDKFSSVGIKELVWTKTGSGWKILKETWMSS